MIAWRSRLIVHIALPLLQVSPLVLRGQVSIGWFAGLDTGRFDSLRHPNPIIG